MTLQTARRVSVKGLCVTGSESTSQSTVAWLTKLIQPLFRDSRSNDFQRDIILSLQQSLVCGADLPDQVAALQTRPQWSLGIIRKRLWQFGVERATDLFHRRQVSVSSLSWAGGFTGTLGFHFREAVDDALMAIEEAGRIGAQTLVVAPGGQGIFTYRHARRMAIDGVQRLIGPAADCHLRLAVLVEVGPRFSPRSLLTSWDAAAEFLAEIGAPHVGLAAALPHFNRTPLANQPWEACAANLFVATSSADPCTTLSRQPALATVVETAKVLSRLRAAGFRGAWEFASPSCTAPWWNSREALLHCSSWVNIVARQMRRIRAG